MSSTAQGGKFSSAANPTRAHSSPYPGLRPFLSNEVDIFFGRQDQIDQILEKLANHRFLGVVGISGCGKSSLALAGVIPAIQSGLIAAAGSRWRVATMRPGDRPMVNLATALLQHGVLDRGDFQQANSPHEAVSELGPIRAAVLATLSRGPLGLAEVLTRPLTPGGGPALPPKYNLLLLVDQFEEIFRFRRPSEPKPAERDDADRDEADAFVSLLLESAQQDRVSVFVMLTMRSDYLGDCAVFNGLPERLNDSQFLTPRLSAKQRSEAIECPAKVRGGRVDRNLVSKVLGDMGPEPDQLPLMQHVLMRLWDLARIRPRADDGRIEMTLADYQAIGGLAEALEGHAEEIYQSLADRAVTAQRPGSWSDPEPAPAARAEPPPSEQQRIAEALFRCLSERETGGRSLRRDVRRPTKLGAVADVAGVTPEEVAVVVEAFRAPRVNFVTPSEGALDRETVLDISHESLIPRWKRLRGWVADEARSAEIYRRLEDSARRSRDGIAGYLDPPELNDVTNWWQTRRPTLEWSRRYGIDHDLAKEFLITSQKKYKFRRLRRIALALSLTLGAMVSLIGFIAIRHALQESFIGRLKVVNDNLNVEKKRTDDLNKSLTDVNKDLTVEKQRTDGLNKRLVAQLKEEASLRKHARLALTPYIASAWLSRITAAASQQGVLMAAAAVDVVENERVKWPKHPDELRMLAPSALESESALRRTLGDISGRGFDGHNGSAVTAMSIEARNHALGVTPPDGRRFVTGGADGSVLLHALRPDEPLAAPIVLNSPTAVGERWGPVNVLQIARAGRWLVAASSQAGAVRLWDFRSTPPYRRVDLVSGTKLLFRDLSFDGHWLLTFDQPQPPDFTPGHPRVWDLSADDPKPLDLRVASKGDLPFYSFSQNGKQLALNRYDASGYVWDLPKAPGTGALRPRSLHHTLGTSATQVKNTEFAEDGRLVVTNSDGTACYYDPAAVDKQPAKIKLAPAQATDGFATLATDQRGLWIVTAQKVTPSRATMKPVVQAGPSSTPSNASPSSIPAPGTSAPVSPHSDQLAYVWDLTNAPDDPKPVAAIKGFPRNLGLPFVVVDPKGRRLLALSAQVQPGQQGQLLAWDLPPPPKGRPDGDSPRSSLGEGVPFMELIGSRVAASAKPLYVGSIAISGDARWVLATVRPGVAEYDSQPYLWDLEALNPTQPVSLRNTSSRFRRRPSRQTTSGL